MMFDDDADRDDLWICYVHSDELVVIEDRVEGVDELIAECPVCRRWTK